MNHKIKIFFTLAFLGTAILQLDCREKCGEFEVQVFKEFPFEHHNKYIRCKESVLEIASLIHDGYDSSAYTNVSIEYRNAVSLDSFSIVSQDIRKIISKNNCPIILNLMGNVMILKKGIDVFDDSDFKLSFVIPEKPKSWSKDVTLEGVEFQVTPATSEVSGIKTGYLGFIRR